MDNVIDFVLATIESKYKEGDNLCCRLIRSMEGNGSGAILNFNLKSKMNVRYTCQHNNKIM